MKKKIIILVCFIIVLAGVLFFIINKNSEDKNDKNTLKEVKVAEVAHTIFYAPAYAAISKGYFEDEGIKINLTLTAGADKVTAAVLSGDVDVGFCGSEATIYVYNSGEKDYLVNFARLTKKDGSFLVSRKKYDNFKLEDLKGKTVIPGRKGGVPYMTLEYVIKQKGLTPGKDLTLDDSIKFDLMASAFTSGSADYVTLFEPTASNIEKLGKGYIVASVGKESGEIPYTAYFAKKSYIENNETTIQNFTNAIYKGQKWVKEHTAKEIAEAIQSFFPDTDIELLATAIQSYKDIDAWNETPVLKQESFDKLQEVMSSAGELKVKAPYDKIINNKYAQEVTK